MSSTLFKLVFDYLGDAVVETWEFNDDQCGCVIYNGKVQDNFHWKWGTSLGAGSYVYMLWISPSNNSWFPSERATKAYQTYLKLIMEDAPQPYVISVTKLEDRGGSHAALF